MFKLISQCTAWGKTCMEYGTSMFLNKSRMSMYLRLKMCVLTKFQTDSNLLGKISPFHLLKRRFGESIWRMITALKECFASTQRAPLRSTVEQRKSSQVNGHLYMRKECLLSSLMEWGSLQISDIILKIIFQKTHC